MWLLFIQPPGSRHNSHPKLRLYMSVLIGANITQMPNINQAMNVFDHCTIAEHNNKICVLIFIFMIDFSFVPNLHAHTVQGNSASGMLVRFVVCLVRLKCTGEKFLLSGLAAVILVCVIVIYFWILYFISIIGKYQLVTAHTNNHQPHASLCDVYRISIHHIC
jgi:hypothetical protein